MKTPATTGSGDLTFAWLYRPKNSLALPGFLFLSLLIHALTFYVFQVAYPPPVSVAPPPVQVNVLAPTSPENQELLRWIESEDPATIANPREISPGNMGDVSYQPSFASVRTAPKTFEEKVPAVYFPPAVNGAALIPGTKKKEAAVREIKTVRQTELRFSGLLAGRKIDALPEFKPDAVSIANPAQTSFFVGVSPDGAILYLFLQSGSGDAGLDRQAESHLAAVRFARVPGGVAWGFATFFWGDDARAPIAMQPPQASR